MSIVTYYARVSASLLAKLRENPDGFWDVPQRADGDDLMDLDKDWSALSYLLSAKSREEHKYNMALQAVMRCQSEGEDLSDKAAWQTALEREAHKLGFALTDTRAAPDDPLLIAIEGRGPEDRRIADIGYGALVFGPDEVSALSVALDRVTAADLRQFFDPQTMERLDVAGILWTEEEPDVFEKILLPCFARLQAFYRRASAARQHVLVACQ